MASKYLCPACHTTDWNLDPVSEDIGFCKCGESFELSELVTQPKQVPYRWHYLKEFNL